MFTRSPTDTPLGDAGSPVARSPVAKPPDAAPLLGQRQRL